MHPASLYGRVYVLRIGHRPGRDERVTTHVGLVARAFGANGFILGDVCDEGVIASLKKVLKTWGGSMHLECGVSSKSYVSSWRSSGGEVIHLTMYGLALDDVIEEIRSSPKPKLVVVGAEKVERFFYENSDYNVAVGSQPHSEVSALALFLDRLYRGSWSRIYFEGARLKIIPSERGKRVLRV
ncbi:MAG: tRNA (cytidine(56)-2'-O)-methyltransferase [Acidilobaceae archaeon]